MLEQLEPIEMVVLQGTPYCNLNCGYCDLSVESRKQRNKMPYATLERVFRDIFEGGFYDSKLSVIWHSGEPLTLAPDYYQDAIDLVVKQRNTYAQNQVELEFDFQSNAVLISDRWIKFFQKNRNHIRLGISCDGPATMHDAHRKNWGSKPTHEKVLASMELLAENNIPFKVIAVVTDMTLENPDAFFDFFLGWSNRLNGFHFNILADGSLADKAGLIYTRSDRSKYYKFYRHLLARARQVIETGGVFRVQNFTQALDRILGTGIDNIQMASRPLRTLNVDASGFITTFYAGLDRSTFRNQYGDGQGLSLGNIGKETIADMVSGKKFLRILADFEESQSACRENCDYYDLCSGGFELSKLSEHGRFDGNETAECHIIVKTLADAVLDDIADNAPTELAAE